MILAALAIDDPSGEAAALLLASMAGGTEKRKERKTFILCLLNITVHYEL